MEADFLRLILFLVGIVVVLMVYFWERHKRVNAKVHAIRNAEQDADKMHREIEAEKQVVMGERQKDAEPSFGDLLEGEKEIGSSHDENIDPDVEELSGELDQLSELVAEESHQRLDHAEQIPLFAEEEEPQSEKDIESKVIIINLVSRQAGFNGQDILVAVADVGLEPGEMGIYHRLGETKRQKKKTLFSMASMVEPGTFPFDAMEGFVTPGLVLFLQISGAQGGLALYDEMLMIAGKLVEHLGGELQDERHCALTHQALEYQREEIIEYQRRQMLAKSNIAP